MAVESQTSETTMQQHKHIGQAAGIPRRRRARVPATVPVTAPPPRPRPTPGELRWRLEALIERLIDALDAIDGDADFDPTADDDCCPAHDDDPAWSCGPGWGAAGDADDAEPFDDEEASAQPPVTPDSPRPARGGGSRPPSMRKPVAEAARSTAPRDCASATSAAT